MAPGPTAGARDRVAALPFAVAWLDADWEPTERTAYAADRETASAVAEAIDSLYAEVGHATIVDVVASTGTGRAADLGVQNGGQRSGNGQ